MSDGRAEIDALYNVDEFEAAARAALPALNYARVSGGAGSNSTVRRNREAFDAWLFRPRALVDIRHRDPSTTVLGSPLAFPAIIAPQAQMAGLHPDAEIAVAQAAGEAGIVMGVSMGASRALADIAATATGPLWFQPYATDDKAVLRDMLDRAAEAGCVAVCLTVDSPINGWREADMRGLPVLPEGAGWPNMPPEYRPGSGVWLSTGGFDWNLLAWFLSSTSLPVVMKGVLDPRDATLAVAEGVAAVCVSNHGGRQLADSITGIEALPAVVDAIGGDAEVLVDGGVRRGTDIAKAIALGARAVMLGRAISWGLAVGGRAGVARVLSLLRGEFDSVMANLGVTTVSGLGRDSLAARR